MRLQLAEGRLRSALDPYLRATGILQILWPPGRHLSPKVRAFIDYMAKNVLSV